MNDLPNPLTPADCDLAGYRWMPLDVERVIDSDTFGLSTGDEFKTAFRLWAKSWKQVPAASLPSDDRLLAHLAGIELATWRKRKEIALRGWILCNDGRLYHPVIAEKALEAMQRREEHADREENTQSRQQRLRERRKAMFEQLRRHDIIPAWDTKTSELERLVASLGSPQPVTQTVTPETPSVTGGVPESVTGGVTRDAPATAIEKDRTGQDSKPMGTVVVTGASSGIARDDFRPKDAAEWLRHLRKRHGFEADPTSVNDRKKLWPVFAGWTNAGLTTAFVDDAIAAAIRDASEPIVCLPLYVDRCMANANAARASPNPSWTDQNAQTIAALTGRNRSHEPDDRTIDV
ncbi:DUF1376 domain-containing protein [Burkholderia cepacia]|uniref:DUF1376 domain-containing protein n=1 Tax=Burkholderia cepacia TaxID=292 RepID=UPI00264DCBB8|nr:DUF1376 domain-containing protein [Burkholderia cepacia]MDN7897179.1 DUF1376 domain-containing protein [Burkholderia cepacia]